MRRDQLAATASRKMALAATHGKNNSSHAQEAPSFCQKENQ